MKTKLEARPYRIGDCLLFDLQAEQALDCSPAEFQRLATTMPAGPAWTFWRAGEPIAAGGLTPTRRGLFEAWALLSRQARSRERFALFDFALAALDNFPHRRIEATVRGDFPAACASLVRLGFDFEGVMRKAAWDGADLKLFARVK